MIDRRRAGGWSRKGRGERRGGEGGGRGVGSHGIVRYLGIGVERSGRTGHPAEGGEAPLSQVVLFWCSASCT